MKSLRRKKRILVITFVAGLTLLLYSADYSVGKIIDYTGDIRLDSFGKGHFHDVTRKNERLYKHSIITTGQDSRLTVEIMGKTLNIPSRSEFSVFDIIEIEQKKDKLDWFPPLLGLINKMADFLFIETEDVDLVSRGDGQLSLIEIIFAYEEDIMEEDIDFFVELNLMQVMENFRENGYSEGEYKYKTGICYFQTGNYRDAEKLFRQSIEVTEENSYYHESLILLTGISNYLIGRNKDAVNYFNIYLTRSDNPLLLPYATWLMIDSLRTTGKIEQARALIEKAEITDEHLAKNFDDYLESITPGSANDLD